MKSTMKSTMIAIGAVAFMCAVFAGRLYVTAGVQDDQVDKVRQLQTERMETLEVVASFLVAQYREGRVDIERVLLARRELLAAKLALSSEKADRISLLKEQLESAKQWEAIANARFQAATATKVDQLTAKAARIQAEIMLLQEK